MAQATNDAKNIHITGPSSFGLTLSVDFDDVNHADVAEKVVRLVNLLAGYRIDHR